MHRRLSNALLYFASVALLPCGRTEAQEPEAAALDLPEAAPECVRWAAGELAAVLRARHFTPAAGPPPQAIRVRIGPPAENPLGPAPQPPQAEAFALACSAEGVVMVSGGGGVGAMYGLLELAEQIAGAPPAPNWRALARTLTPLARRPVLPVRGENAFLHVNPEGQPAPWFQDEEFWRRYLELLARSRFNLLDLHGGYSPASTAFSNLLPLFTGGGAGTPQAGRLAMLRRIVALAEARGIHVGLMNYESGGLSGAATAARVEELLRACPGLWLFGARVKRAGAEAAEKFEQACLRPARAAGFAGRMYTRSWGSDRKTMVQLGRACQEFLAVEVKFNGEQLGLPYPAILGWGEDYSYQDFLLRPRPFEVLWQVRANGTHRVFPWGDPRFVREAVASFQLGGAWGFTLEPQTAYYSVRLDERYRECAAGAALSGVQELPGGPAGGGKRGDEQEAREQFLFERNWAWYALWGRLAYAPDTSDRDLERLFVARHGPRAGPAAFRTLACMSRVVPKVCASYAVGVDHRAYAPELEIGLYSRDPKDGARSLDELCAIRPLDRVRGCSPDEYAAAVAGGMLEPRVNPVDAAAELDAVAEETDVAAAELIGALGEAGRLASARALALEARALAQLGRSHAARLRALTAYALFRHTGDACWLPQAQAELARSAAHWKELAESADKIYLPIPDPLRAGNGFTWGSVQAHFTRLQEELEKKASGLRKKGRGREGEPEPAGALRPGRGNLPEPRVAWARGSKGAWAVTLRFPPSTPAPRGLALRFRPLRSEAAWERQDLEWDRSEQSFRAALREPQGGLLFFFQAVDDLGRGCLWPASAAGLPYYWSLNEPAAP